MMDHFRDVIIAPVLTEKSYGFKDKNTYVFKVSNKANKVEIKQAIEGLFSVKVERVNTVNTKSKTKTRGRIIGHTSAYKKAYVKLADGNEINLG